MPKIACMNPSAWNIGTHSSVVSRARNGTLLSRPPTSDERLRLGRGAPFGVPVVPLVRIVMRGRSSGLGGALRVAAVDQSVDRVVAGLVGPREEASVRRIVDSLNVSAYSSS